MNTDKHSAPSPPIKKDNGKWTFYVFPDGEEREAGQYETEAAAKAAEERLSSNGIASMRTKTLPREAYWRTMIVGSEQ